MLIVLSGPPAFSAMILLPAQVTAYISYRPEGIFKIRKIRDPGVMEDAERGLHGIAPDHTPDDHLVGIF